MKKKMLVLTVAAMLVGSAPAYAGQWQQGQGDNSGKWHYMKDDGSLAANGWQAIDGAFYYFDSDGWMLADTTTPDGYKVGADGAWIQEGPNAGVETTAVQEEQSIYPVSAPENVHWTEQFQVSWSFGKNRNGQVHHKYSCRIYNSQTGECIRDNTVESGNSSFIRGLRSFITDKMETGQSYYFEVWAVDSNNYQMSAKVKSESKVFTKPNEIIPAPVNLRWNGTTAEYDVHGIGQEMTDLVHIRLYYSPTRDGEYKFLYGGSYKVRKEYNLLNQMKAPGYYKFIICLISKDIQKALSSDYSDYSPIMHYTK